MTHEWFGDTGKIRQSDMAFVTIPSWVVVAAVAAVAVVVADAGVVGIAVGVGQCCSGGFGDVCSLPYGPFRVAIQGKCIRDPFLLFSPGLVSRWDDLGATCEGAYGGELVLEWSMGVEVYILVSMCRLAVDIKGEGAVGIALDIDVKHVYVAVSFLFLHPFDV